MHTFVKVLEVLGACTFVFFAVCVGATVVDVLQRWRSGNWEA